MIKNDNCRLAGPGNSAHCCGGGTEDGHAPWCKTKGMDIMSGPHVEPNQERSIEARIERLRVRTKEAMRKASYAGEPTGPYVLFLGVLDLLGAEL